MNLDGLVITDQKLGKGGFGSVFACQLDEKRVAAKKLSESKEEVDNLVREASKLKRLRHGKHIAYTYGITLRDENLYIVIEYGRFGDLKSFLNRNAGSVAYEQKILFCRGILLGLLYCHSMEIFHGDIKCSNVILGKNLEPKLADFGLSMTVDNIAYYSKLYDESLYWTAPELFSIKDETVYQEFIADPYPCDVYSLGAIFCEISYDGTTDFIDSDDPGTDISLGIVSPISKDGFLVEIIDECCQFERNERISLDECLSVLDNLVEAQLPVPAINDKWQEIQQDIQANSKLELPHSFILHRPAENLVVGPSNLSLLEWLCINSCTDAVKYMIQLCEHNQNQIKWLCEISKLCEYPEVVSFLQSLTQNNERSYLRLSDLIDSNPQQFIEMLIKAGASCCSYNLLRKTIKMYHNTTVQTIISNTNYFKNWAILDAAKFGNAEAVKIAVDAGADLEWKDSQTGNTPLITAIENERIEAVKILLGFGVDVHSKNNSTKRGVEAEIPHKPLYLAALKGNREIVKLLIDAGATIDITSSEWHSLSQSLEQQGNISMVHFIRNSISKKSNPVESNSLCAAIRNKQPDLVQTLIDNGVNIDEVGLNGYAPLHWAVIVDDEEIIRILVRASVDLDIRTLSETQNLQSTSSPDYFSECTPLHIAISKGHWGTAKLLIEPGADFSAKNGQQQTVMEIAAKQDKKALEEIIREYVPVNSTSIRRAMESMSPESIKVMINDRQTNAEILSEYLCTATSCGKSDLVKYLLKYGIDINKERRGKTPLEWAIFGENIQAMKVLINAGADINAKNRHKETPLFRCVWESQVDMVQLLVDKGADINDGKTLGYESICCVKDKEVAEILINAGVDINANDQFKGNPLIEYVKGLNAEIVQYLVDKGADVNIRDRCGNTPIYYANDKEIAEILINAGADINAKNKDGETPLIQAVSKSNTKMIQYLVDKGANVNARGEWGDTPIFRANNKKIAEILINAGANINVKNKTGETPLIQSVINSNTEMVQYLVDKGANVNARGRRENTPILHANNKEIAEILINAGADINAMNQHGEIPLIQAVSKSNTKMVQYLVDKGANVNARGRRENTPIFHANNKEIAEILINAGANINVKNEDGKTPLIEYVKGLNTKMIQYLVDKGANVNIRDKWGNAAIYHANNEEIMKILVNVGADVNAKDEYGRTPLIKYAIKSNAEMVQFLVDKGANVNARDKYGKAPIYHANSGKIMKILVNVGADVNAKNQYGRIPLIEYVRKSNTEMVQYLISKGADINVEDDNGKVPIYHTDNEEIMEILINAGADINAKGQYERTPLIEYVRESNAEMVQYLISKGADINVRSENGNTPIHFVRDKENAKILIAAGANINAKNRYGKKLFDILIKEQNMNLSNKQYKRKEVCKLLEYLRDINKEIY